MQGSVLVATDLSAASEEAIVQAHALAGDDRLLAAYIIPRLATAGLDPLFPPAALQTTLASADLEARAQSAIDERVRAISGRAHTDVLVRVGIPEDEIAALTLPERGHALRAVVVGSHGRTGIARMLLGSVAEKVARNAACEVLVARQPPQPDAKPVVVLATDLSEGSERALEAALREATRMDARLFAVHAIEDPHVAAYAELAAAFGASALGPPPEFEREVKDALSAMIARRLQSSSIIAESIVASGAAAPAVVRVAEQVGASLIVVGTGQKSALERFALGSVAEKVVRHAPCSVLVAR